MLRHLDRPGVTFPYKGWLRRVGVDGVFHYFPGDDVGRPAACGVRALASASCRVGGDCKCTLCPQCAAKAPPFRAGPRHVNVRLDLDDVLALDARFGKARRRGIIARMVRGVADGMMLTQPPGKGAVHA